MRFFCHFGVSSFANAYLLGPEEGGDAVLIDPGVFDETLLRMIESNNLYARHVLITHGHEAHTRGIRTLLKIYDATVYSFSRVLLDCESVAVSDGQELELAGIRFLVRETPGHTSDSVVYLTGRYLFTGDTLYAGAIGKAPDAYNRGLILNSIHEKILTLDDDVFLFPGHGPPSKIGIERQLNPDLHHEPLGRATEGL